MTETPEVAEHCEGDRITICFLPTSSHSGETVIALSIGTTIWGTVVTPLTTVAGTTFSFGEVQVNSRMYPLLCTAKMVGNVVAVAE